MVVIYFVVAHCNFYRKNDRTSLRYTLRYHGDVMSLIYITSTIWWNSDYVVNIEVHAFLEIGLQPKY